MILIIISLILVIVSAALLGVDVEEGELNFRPRMLFSLLFLGINLFGCFSTVKTGEIGIKTRFGKITNTYLSEGINFKLPFEKIETVNIKVQKYENEETLETSTKDMQIVTGIKVVVNFQVEGGQAVELYRNVGSNYKETVLEPSIQETIKSIISKYTAEELVTKRSDVAIDIQNTLNDRTHKYGINIVSININNFDFSKTYNESIERKAVAEQNALTAQQELETTKAEAEKKKIEAQAEADANKIKEKSLTDKIIQQQFIEKWNGELPKVTNGNNIFDISSLLK